MGAGPRRESLRILVCEDQDAIRHMIETLVSATGHRVSSVDTGSKAVESAMAGHFDLLLLDLMLPGQLDGFEVCRRLRADESTKDMPIFVISAMPDARQRALDAGATRFFEKPFSPVALLKDLEGIKRRKR